MKYTNPLTQELLKEFRKFNKYAKDGLYSFHANSLEEQQKDFNHEIRRIIKRWEIQNPEGF